MFDGISRSITVLVAVGLFVGVVLAGSDGCSPWTGPAKQRRMDLVTQHEERKFLLEEERIAEANAIELERMRTEANAATEAAKKKGELDLKTREFRENALGVAFGVGVVILAGGAAALLIMVGYRWSGLAERAARPDAAESADIWQNEVFRQTQIQLGRMVDQLSRSSAVQRSGPQMVDYSADLATGRRTDGRGQTEGNGERRSRAFAGVLEKVGPTH